VKVKEYLVYNLIKISFRFYSDFIGISSLFAMIFILIIYFSKNMNILIKLPNERIINRIFLIRGKKVMFDKDLAELYGVETKVLNQAVKRNLKRFPSDFMFKLNAQEIKNWKSIYLRSQIVTLEHGRHIKYSPYVFTEQGVAMLSSILNSDIAIEVNIQIIRTFTKLREILSDNKKLVEKIENMEKKYDSKIARIFEVIKRLVKEDEKPKEPIGFHVRNSR
jgi:hypothetical protein